MAPDTAAFAAQLEAFVRGIARDEFAKIMLEQHRTSTAPLVTEKGTGICGLERDGKVCLKEHSSGRHKFSPKPRKAPQRDWEPITEFRVQGTGSRSYTVRVKDQVKVKGLGKYKGTTGDGFRVVSAERHTQNGKINVTVRRGVENPRIVTSDKIVHKGPPRKG